MDIYNVEKALEVRDTTITLFMLCIILELNATERGSQAKNPHDVIVD